METLVQKIHNEIDSAQDILLSNANMFINNVEKKSIEKGKRLESLGFINTPDAINTKQQIIELEKNEKISKLIIEYSKVYPFLKFITIDKFDEICDKYNLIYAPVSRYIKTIPEKNIKELENIQPLQLSHKNVNLIKISITSRYFDDNTLNSKQRYELSKGIILPETKNYIKSIREYYNDNNIIFLYSSDSQFIVESIDKSGLFIAAPKSHFNLVGLKTHNKGFFNFIKIEPKDPIVFRYVAGGIQILSKWGDEANDSELTVSILN